MLLSEKILKETIIDKLQRINVVEPQFKTFSDAIICSLYQINALDIDYKNPANKIAANAYNEKIVNLLTESMEKRYIGKDNALEILDDIHNMRQENFQYLLKHIENVQQSLAAVKDTAHSISGLLSPENNHQPHSQPKSFFLSNTVNTIKKIFSMRTNHVDNDIQKDIHKTVKNKNL